MYLLKGIVILLIISKLGFCEMNIVVNTWPFTKATDAAWCEILKSGNAMLAVERGCTEAEYDLSIPTVGYGGSPDEKDNVTLDAMIMNGDTKEVGAVASMPYIKNAIKVAHYVLKYTRHTLLVGEKASEFGREMGFNWESLDNNASHQIYKKWMNNKCQPNFRRNVFPDPNDSCGPYKPKQSINLPESGDNNKRVPGTVSESHHDTIGMVVLSRSGSIAVGTSTNGASHRVPGRVGDTAIVGAGGYADSEIGGAAATGDGDLLMRYLLSYETVRLMEEGFNPTQAATKALRRIKQPGTWYGALVALNKSGEYGGACVGFSNYYISIRSNATGNSTKTQHIECIPATQLPAKKHLCKHSSCSNLSYK